MEKTMEKLLHIRDVADVLSVHPNTVRRLVTTGRLRAIRISPRGDLRFRESDVRDYMTKEQTIFTAV